MSYMHNVIEISSKTRRAIAFVIDLWTVAFGKGQANILIKVKGENKSRIINVFLTKTRDSEWEVAKMN